METCDLFVDKSWDVVVAAIVMFGGWTLAYLLIAIRCFKEKTYGVPIFTQCTNFSWELIFALNLFAVPVSIYFRLGYWFWLLFDCVLLFQLFYYGKRSQTNPLMKKYFYLIAGGTLLLSFPGLYYFIIYFNDYGGVSSSIMMDFLIGLLYLNLFLARPTLKGLSYRAAWLKMFANAAGFYVCFKEYPLSFTDGVWNCSPHFPEPTSFMFLNLIYLVTPFMDITYVAGMRWRRKQIAGEAG